MKILEINGQKTWVVLARYQPFSCRPEKEGIIRIDDFKQACIMQTDGKVGSKGQWVGRLLGVCRVLLRHPLVFCSVYVLLRQSKRNDSNNAYQLGGKGNHH